MSQPHPREISAWDLFRNVSLLQTIVVLYSVFVISHIAPLFEPDLEQPRPYALFLLLVAYPILFVPTTLIWSVLVKFFYGLYGLRSGVIISAIFFVFILLGMFVPFFTSNQTKGLLSLLSLENGVSVVFWSYGSLLIAGLYWSAFSPTAAYRVPKTSLEVDWNSEDN